MRVLRSAVLFLALAATATTAQAPFEALCIHVTDGDTLTVLRGSEQIKVRLDGIDAPEPGQDFSSKATQALADMAKGRTLLVAPSGQDRFGRTLARVSLDGEDLAHRMLMRGLAWHFFRYNSDPTLAALERDARSRRVGLWSVANPTAPWDFRTGASTPPQSNPLVSPPSSAPTSSPRPSRPAAASTIYRCNRQSGVFHRPGCQHYYCKNCTREFSSTEAAIAGGCRPGGCCKP